MLRSFNLLCFRSPRRRRSRSSSRSKRSRHRRSRSREWRWRSRSHSQDRSEREKDRERRQKGLPSLKSQTLSGMCYNRNKPVNMWVMILIVHIQMLEPLLHASHNVISTLCDPVDSSPFDVFFSVRFTSVSSAYNLFMLNVEIHWTKDRQGNVQGSSANFRNLFQPIEQFSVINGTST